MARCYCRRHRVLICLCTPCIILILLFILSIVMICSITNGTSAPGVAVIPVIDRAHFVASGLLSNKSFAPLPKTFWEHHKEAFWNRLQLTTDRHFNPILQPYLTRGFKKSISYDSILKQSFSEVIDLGNSKRGISEQLPQQLQEFTSHMQRRDYPTLIEPVRLCGAGSKDEEEPPFLLLAIKSTELNFKNRQAIRQTWGQVGWVAGRQSNSTGRGESGGYVHRVFLLGKKNTENLDGVLSELLLLESKIYGDILQWDFKDTFFNLALKDVLFWSWFSRSCAQARFVFKGDDDVFVNTPNIITYLHDQLKKPQAHKTMKDLMVGDVIAAAAPNRVNKSKYFIPDSFYKGFYPMYAGGGGVVYSGQLTKRLHEMSKRVHLFPIDDVYVGMCMIRLNAHPIHHPAFLTFDFPGKDEEKLCSYHTILLVHKRSPEQLVELWANMNKTQAQCRDMPLRGERNKEGNKEGNKGGNKVDTENVIEPSDL